MSPTSALAPTTLAQAAAMLADCAARARPVCPVGAGTRQGWIRADQEPTDQEPTDQERIVELRTSGLDQPIEHNPGDFTAVVGAGVPLAAAQRTFAEAGQWLAVDPPHPDGTVGGLVATADSGPGRHRYGAIRDLVIGVTVVLSDGTVASAGGRVIKNVAGYDLAKLFTGSFGTLGLIASVALRLHPLPAATATLTGTTDRPELLGRVVLALTRAPLEALSLDVWWRDSTAVDSTVADSTAPTAGTLADRDAADVGGVLVRFAGVAAAESANRARVLLRGLDEVAVAEQDEPLWAGQRARQRSRDGVVLKVAGRATDLPAVVAAARAHRAGVVGRAALGLSWLNFAPGADVAERVQAARAALAPRACVVLDGAHLVPEPWPAPPPATLALMRRVKARFDPAGIMRPGAFAGGI